MVFWAPRTAGNVGGFGKYTACGCKDLFGKHSRLVKSTCSYPGSDSRPLTETSPSFSYRIRDLGCGVDRDAQSWLEQLRELLSQDPGSGLWGRLGNTAKDATPKILHHLAKPGLP